MAKQKKATQSQRRKAQKARAAAAALTGPPPSTTGPRDGAVHRVVLPAARGRQSGLRKQVEMVEALPFPSANSDWWCLPTKHLGRTRHECPTTTSNCSCKAGCARSPGGNATPPQILDT